MSYPAFNSPRQAISYLRRMGQIDSVHRDGGSGRSYVYVKKASYPLRPDERDWSEEAKSALAKWGYTIMFPPQLVRASYSDEVASEGWYEIRDITPVGGVLRFTNGSSIAVNDMLGRPVPALDAWSTDVSRLASIATTQSPENNP